MHFNDTENAPEYAEDTGVRINRFVAESGKCSRREADRWIEDGRVTINDRIATLGDKVFPGMKVAVDGEVIKMNRNHKYIILNKPVGIVCTCDPNEDHNVVKFIDHDRRIYPIGRLDKDSEGLLLLTDDGDIVNRILRAENRHEKEYEVIVDKPVTPEFVKKMSSGVRILGTTTLPCKVTRTGDRSFNIILTQGLNRQIRRMCEVLGYNVRSLRRTRIMFLRLGNLKLGQWRNLSPSEMTELNRELEL